MPRTTSPSAVSAALARDRLGVPAVMSFVMGGIAALTVSAGVIPTAYATTGLTAIPAAFVVVAVVLGVFSVGYLAMARHIQNCGSFYAFVTRGLGRPAGVGAALMAVVAYNLLQIGLYGAFGPGMASYASDKFGLHAPWWAWALGTWALVTVLGRLRVDLNGKVLAVLIGAEILVTVLLMVAGLAHPDHGHVSVATLEPTKLLTPGVGALLVIAVLGYVGVEGAVVLTEEARNPRRTVPIATFAALGLIAFIYAGVSWAMAVHYGDGQVSGVAGKLGPDALFSMGSSLVADIGRTLYLTSLFAAMLAFHGFCTRYMFALGREGVLPRTFGRTGRSGSPKVASSVQSLTGLAVILLYAAEGWSPLVRLFFWLGTTGGFGILVLFAVTSVAVIGFFARQPSGESVWRRVIAPGLASICLTVMVWLAVDNYATLLGEARGSAAATWLPAIFAVAAGVGVVWALILRGANSEVYATIGLGADAATSGVVPVFASTTMPGYGTHAAPERTR